MIDHLVTSYYCTCNHYEALIKAIQEDAVLCLQLSRQTEYLLHSPLLETRMQGILSYQFKTDGFLRWAYNCWPEQARTDIRYNTSSLPIGDLCFVYPGNHGHILLSLRYKQPNGELKILSFEDSPRCSQPKQTDALVADFLKVTDTKHWMIDSHHSHPAVFLQTAKEMEVFVGTPRTARKVAKSTTAHRNFTTISQQNDEMPGGVLTTESCSIFVLLTSVFLRMLFLVSASFLIPSIFLYTFK